MSADPLNINPLFNGKSDPYFLDTKHQPVSNENYVIFPLNHNTLRYDTSGFTPDKVDNRVGKAELDFFIEKLYTTCNEFHPVER